MLSALFTPDTPTCGFCKGPLGANGWIAWTTDDDMRMQELWFVCGWDLRACHERLPRCRSDHEVSKWLGSRRAFWLLEDVIDTYRPSHELTLRLVQFCSWAARQRKDKAPGWGALIGGEP